MGLASPGGALARAFVSRFGKKTDPVCDSKGPIHPVWSEPSVSTGLELGLSVLPPLELCDVIPALLRKIPI